MITWAKSLQRIECERVWVWQAFSKAGTTAESDAYMLGTFMIVTHESLYIVTSLTEVVAKRIVVSCNQKVAIQSTKLLALTFARRIIRFSERIIHSICKSSLCDDNILCPTPSVSIALCPELIGHSNWIDTRRRRLAWVSFNQWQRVISLSPVSQRVASQILKTSAHRRSGGCVQRSNLATTYGASTTMRATFYSKWLTSVTPPSPPGDRDWRDQPDFI